MFNNIPDSFAEAILCSISEPAIIFNSAIEVVWTNPSAELFFGHSTEFMTGKNCTDLFSGVLECFDDCPVEKAMLTDRNEVLLVDGVIHPHKLIEAIPYKSNDLQFTLAIVHSIPEVDRNLALRRDFAALLNQSATLDAAAHDIINAVKNLASVSACGVYVKSHNKFNLLVGEGVPEFIADIDYTSPVYLSRKYLPFDAEDSFPDGAAIVPVIGPEGETRLLLLAEGGTMNTTFRRRLEMIACVLESCIMRLLV